MKNQLEIKDSIRNSSINLLMMLFFLGQFYIKIGFALKPYMIGAIFLFAFFALANRLKYQIIMIDKLIGLLIAIMAVGLLFSYDKMASLRYIAGTLLVCFSALQYRSFLDYVANKDNLENSISYIGIIYGIVTVVYYFMGLMYFNWNFYGNNINAYGVLIDRSFPRLVTYASDDPNISFLFLSFFFCFYLCNLNRLRNYLGLGLFALLCLLTMSRAAYISMAIMLILFYVHNHKGKAIGRITKLFIFLLIVSVVLFSASEFFNISIINIMKSRFDFNSSGMHSGRLTLWKNAFNTFLEHPILGIGINSSLSYNALHYGTIYYVHNTYLEVLSETGFVGFIVYISLILYIIRQNKHNIDISIFPYCYTISVLVQNFFLSTLINEMFFMLLIITSLYQRYRVLDIDTKRDK